MTSTVFHGLHLGDDDHGRGLWLRKFTGQAEPVLTNIRVAGMPRTKAKRGSALVNVATGLLMILAIALYIVSITAQWRYVMDVKHDSLISWIEAASLDGGMAIFSLLALGLSRAGQSAKVERLMIVACAVGSAAMNYAAADTGSIRSALAYCAPPIFLAAVTDRTISVIRRHYLGDEDASAWHNLGKVVLYGLRLIFAPISSSAGLRRALLNRTPVPAPAPKPLEFLPCPVFEVVRPEHAAPAAKAVTTNKPKAITAKPKQAKKSGSGKQADLIRRAVENHNLADRPLSEVSKLATQLAAECSLHPATARRVLLAHARELQGSDAR